MNKIVFVAIVFLLAQEYAKSQFNKTTKQNNKLPFGSSSSSPPVPGSSPQSPALSDEPPAVIRSQTRPSILCVTQKRAFMPLYIVLGQ